jgi:hypothetical protein
MSSFIDAALRHVRFRRAAAVGAIALIAGAGPAPAAAPTRWRG